MYRLLELVAVFLKIARPKFEISAFVDGPPSSEARNPPSRLWRSPATVITDWSFTSIRRTTLSNPPPTYTFPALSNATCCGVCMLAERAAQRSPPNVGGPLNAYVVTLFCAVLSILRIRLLLVSATKRLLFASNAIPQLPLNVAELAAPLAEPAVPVPAKFEMLPPTVKTRMRFRPPSEI